jgi:DNA polymerase-3 subunit epsilon
MVRAYEPGPVGAERAPDVREGWLRRWLRVPEGLGFPGWAARLAGAVRAVQGRPLSRVVFGIVDLETTGLSSRRDRILEIGLVVQRAGRALEHFEALVDPGGPIPPEITALTGIRDDDVAGAPDERTALAAFAAVLRRHEVEVLVAHNARFDRGFLTRAWIEHAIAEPLPPFLCSLRLARRLITAPRYGLTSLVAELRLPERARHRALGDAEMAAALGRGLLVRARRDGHSTLEALAAVERRDRLRRPGRHGAPALRSGAVDAHGPIG